MSTSNIGVRAFLKKLGFQFGVSQRSLDLAFRNSFPVKKRGEIDLAWMNLHDGRSHISEIYGLPQNEKQAALLLSTDADRQLLSMGWCEKVFNNYAPTSVIDAGCGVGYLTRFLAMKYPATVFTGIDRQKNLIDIASIDINANFICSSFEDYNPEHKVDLIICEFGWDSADIGYSTKPHSTEEISGLEYCPGCSDDESDFYFQMIKNWKHWLAPGGKIAIIGRFSTFGSVRGLYQAAIRLELSVKEGGFETLVLKNKLRDPEVFSAFILSFKDSDGKETNLETIANTYANTL